MSFNTKKNLSCSIYDIYNVKLHIIIIQMFIQHIARGNTPIFFYHLDRM